jgi:hypothetical protein
LKTKIRDIDGKPFPIWKTPLSKLRNYGLGLWLYMLFLKWMAAITILLSLIITPVFICNMAMLGIPRKDQISVFDRFTLANQANEQDSRHERSYWPWMYEKLQYLGISSEIVVFTDVTYSLTFAL